jgi:hypothetical protein
MIIGELIVLLGKHNINDEVVMEVNGQLTQIHSVDHMVLENLQTKIIISDYHESTDS